VLAYAFADEAVKLSLAAERRAPHVTVRQLLVARVAAGVVKYRATFFYDVRYSGVKSLRVDLPAAQADRVRILTPSVRYTVIDDGPATNTADVTAWRIEGETEFMGSSNIRMEWEEKIDKLDVGKSVLLAVPRLVPRDVDRAWGQIVLAKAEAIDVAPAEDHAGLRPIDPAHDLMPGARIADAARAFEFHDAWSLSIKATRYEPKDVKATSIERGLVRMVLTRGDVTSVQALYRMRSARQRLVIDLPGEVSFDTQPLHVNGRPVSLEQGEKGRYFVPLVTLPQDTPFLLELRYLVAGSGSALRIPSFPKEPAVQQVYLSAYLPRDRTYLGYRGPWNDEMVWVLRGFNSWPRGNKTSEQLLAWVSGGLGVDLASLRNFPTDGRHLLYSTLRPETDAAGALRPAWVPTWLLQTVLLVLIVGGGLALVAVPLGPRAVVVGAAVTAVVVLAVFAPSLARSIVNNATVAAAFIVLVVWALWFLLVTLPRSPAWQERRRLKAERRRLKAQRARAAAAKPVAAATPPAPPPAPPAEGGKSNA
jgi:hypothetical protein